MDNNNSKPKLLGCGRGISIAQRWREANAERQLVIATAAKQNTNIDSKYKEKLDFNIHYDGMFLYKYAKSQCIGDCLDYLAERIKTIDFNTSRIALACEQPDDTAELAKELGKRSIASLLVNRLSDEINTCISSWRKGLINGVIIISDNVLPQVAECHRLNCVTLLVNANVPLPHVFHKRIATFAVGKGTFLENLVLVYPPPPAIETSEINATAAPDSPESAEAPNSPEVLGSQEVPNSPDAPNSPDLPEAPGLPEVSDSEEVSYSEEVSDSDEMPDLVPIPFPPDSQEVPKTPEVPETPKVPKTSEAPNSPDAPNSPEAPDLPEAPGSPEVSDSEEVSDSDEMPDLVPIPSPPDSQEVPKTPEVPETPEVPKTSEAPNSPETPEADATQSSDDLAPFPFLSRPGYLCHDESKTENIYAFNKKNIFVWTRKLGTECNNIDEVNNVKDYIKNAMNRQAIGVQRFAWPLAADNRSMCIIGNRGTGKSWSYLPTLCQRYAEAALRRTKKSANGPSCIIICTNAAEGDKIAKSCQTLLDAWNVSNQSFIQKLFTRCDLDRLRTMNFTGILIANCDLLWQFKLKLGRIKCIAFDDFPASLRYASDFENLLNYLLKKLKFDEDHAQLFIVGRAWSDIILERVLNILPDVMLMFEDPLEATAFFNVQMDLRLISPNNGISSIMEMLQEMLQDEDLDDEYVYIACCEKNDALVLGQSLNEAQIEYTILEPHLIHEFIMNPTKIVMVYDEAIPKLLNGKLGIRCLIHYTIPAAWMVFKARFALLYNDYPQEPKSSNVKSIIPMSRIDSSQMWFMCNFLFTQGRLPPENCLSLLKLLRQQNESQYPRDLQPLCHQVVAFGNCYRQQCCFRHVFWTNEVYINDDLPTSDKIRFRVLTNKTPSLCCVRLEKFPHHINFFNHSVTILGEQIQKDYELKEIKNRHVNPKSGDICIILMNRLYQRVKVLKVQSKEEIQVIQLDVGSDFFLVKASDLLECDTKYLDKEFEACDVRVIGLSPLNADRRWSEAIKRLVRHKFFSRKITTDRLYTANIMYQFHSILYVSNIYDEEGNDLISFVLQNCPSYVDDNVLLRLEKLRETAKDPRGDVEEEDT